MVSTNSTAGMFFDADNGSVSVHFLQMGASTQCTIINNRDSDARTWTGSFSTTLIQQHQTDQLTPAYKNTPSSRPQPACQALHRPGDADYSCHTEHGSKDIAALQDIMIRLVKRYRRARLARMKGLAYDPEGDDASESDGSSESNDNSENDDGLEDDEDSDAEYTISDNFSDADDDLDSDDGFASDENAHTGRLQSRYTPQASEVDSENDPDGYGHCEGPPNSEVDPNDEDEDEDQDPALEGGWNLRLGRPNPGLLRERGETKEDYL